MPHIGSGGCDKDFEEFLMSSYPTKDEKRLSPVQRRPAIRNTGQKRYSTRDRSQSLSVGNNSKLRPVFLTAPVREQQDSIESGIDYAGGTSTLPNPNRSINNFRTLNTFLLEALRYREVEEIEKLIIAGANPNATCCIECISACHLAAIRPDGALAVLLSHGADRNRFDKTGRTPLHLAAWAGNLRQIAMLLAFSKDLTNRVSTTVMTPALEDEVKNLSLYLKDVVNAKCCISKTQVAALPKEWTDNMIDHNCKEFEASLPLFQPGWTPLHAASSRAKCHCVKLLLAAGSDPSLRDLVGRTPLDIAGSTYYSEDYIDPVGFAETVSALAVDKANFSIKNRKTVDTPFHTAVELNSLEAVRSLLNVNVPVGWLNRAGLTPVHISVKRRSQEILQMLVNHKQEIENDPNFKAAIEVRDKDGHTALHAAVIEGWVHGVNIIIDAGANVMAQDNNGETPLHLAAATGNLDILNKFLFVVNQADVINELNAISETPLVKAVLNGHTECVRRLLEEKASLKVSLPNQINVFHLAAEIGDVGVLQVLLDHDYNITRGMINYLAGDRDGFGPLHYAVQNNHPQCVKLLLSRNAFRSLKASLTGIHIGSTPLHIAAITNNVEIAKILMKNNPDTIHKVNSLDWTPLHTACSYGSRDMIILLLKEGADLSALAIGPSGKMKITALDLIMNSLSRPTEFLTYVFDTCISTNDSNIQDPDCEVTVDYQILVPRAEGREQMKVIDALLRTGDRHGQSRLMVHPLIESFLHLKWKALLPFFYTMIAAYGVYVLFLTMYIMSVFFYIDNSYIQRPDWISPPVLALGVYASSFFVVALEALYININSKYFLQFETWVKFGAMVLALNLPNALGTWEGSFKEYTRHLASLALLLSWLEMMFLLSRFPNWGYYVLMFGKVSCNVIKILLTFSFVVIGFSLSFMVEFRHEIPFEDPWAAFIKTLVMMASEFDYGDLAEHDFSPRHFNSTMQSKEYATSFAILIFQLIFVAFVILASIVLMNLMVGVAVNDLHDLEVLGNIRRLSKQVEFLVSLDTLLYNRYVRQILPKNLERMLLKKKTILAVMTLRPSDPDSKCYKKLPLDIRNAIFEQAHLQKKQMEEEIGSQDYKKKLDEIHDVIVVKTSGHQGYSEVANNFHSYDVRGEQRFENIARKIVDLDSGIIDGNKQTSETLNEMRYSIRQLEMKMDMIFNTLQGYSNNRGKHYFKMLRKDKF